MRHAGLLLLAGCAAPYQAPTSYQVHLDAALPTDASTAVVVAAEAWSAALPELRIAVTVDACEGDQQTLCVTQGTNPNGEVMGSTEMGAPVRVTLDIDAIAASGGATVYLTALHELGHGMGLVHHAPGNVMAALQNDMASEPTADDVEQWRSR